MDQQTEKKKVMLSGIQPSGDLHLGNYTEESYTENRGVDAEKSNDFDRGTCGNLWHNP